MYTPTCLRDPIWSKPSQNPDGGNKQIQDPRQDVASLRSRGMGFCGHTTELQWTRYGCIHASCPHQHSKISLLHLQSDLYNHIGNKCFSLQAKTMKNSNIAYAIANLLSIRSQWIHGHRPAAHPVPHPSHWRACWAKMLYAWKLHSACQSPTI